MKTITVLDFAAHWSPSLRVSTEDQTPDQVAQRVAAALRERPRTAANIARAHLHPREDVEDLEWSSEEPGPGERELGELLEGHAVRDIGAAPLPPAPGRHCYTVNTRPVRCPADGCGERVWSATPIPGRASGGTLWLTDAGLDHLHHAEQ